MQIRATIERLEAGIRQGEDDARASTSDMRQRLRKLADYQAELAQREAAVPAAYKTVNVTLPAPLWEQMD